MLLTAENAIGEDAVMIVDTHLHIVDMERLNYPWLAGAPALQRNFSYATYAAEACRLGIEASLYMEVDVAADDIEKERVFIEELTTTDGSLVAGGFTACRPEDEGFAADLDRIRQNKAIKGLRRILHFAPDDLSTSATFRANVRRLAGTGLTFDLVVFPHQHAIVTELVDLAPDVTFIFDHCGVPDIKGGQFDSWRKTVSEIARRPNVIGKISGISAYAAEGWTVETLRPWVDHTIDSFGFDRVLWGSDWPVCTLAGSLSTWVAATHALIEGASHDEKTALLRGNAIRLWNLDLPEGTQS